ncbi:MAG: M23 family metallopeptidase [Acidobacteria bacterium]|nr:M23 family metallopeptidase [Acidobacteriota bacterium]
MRSIVAVVLIVVAAVAGAFFVAGRSPAPVITVIQPQGTIGQASTLEVVVEAPRGDLSLFTATLAQNGQTQTLFTQAPGAAGLTQDGADRVRLTMPVGKASVPQLVSGAARITVTAARTVMFGLRTRSADVSFEVMVRLEPPRVAVMSLHHIVNHGGSEMVVYRATPGDVVASGVRVGDREYPGFPATGAGIPATDPALRVAFFALLWDQDLETPMHVFARDAAGNEATAAIDHRVFPKPFKQSTIDLPDAFLQRVVPAILSNTPSLTVADPGNLEESFLSINRDLRKANADTIASLAAKTAPTILWTEPFLQLGNSQVEASFADQRTYRHNGAEIDRQVHLGFDLAVTAQVPIRASNTGVVVFADYLGIYGNCVVIDHGMGVQSLYAHLSSMDVKPGDAVTRDQPIGRSGMTGLAGGDHLHFTMLVNGQQVTPVDWWSPQWLQDRVIRKWREAGKPAS